MIDTKKLTKELSQKGYSQEQINKIIQWLKDEENGDTYTAEEVHYSLFATEKEYA